MRRITLLALLVATISLAPLLPIEVAWAEGTETATPTPEPSLDYGRFLAEESEVAAEPSLTSVLVGVLWKLGLVVLLAYGVLWVMKRFSVRRVAGSSQQLQVLETVGLGANRSLHIDRVGPQILLIGATPQELRTLADVSNAYDTDEPWTPDEKVAGGDTAEGWHGAHERPLRPSLEAVERIRRLWGRDQS